MTILLAVLWYERKSLQKVHICHEPLAFNNE